MSDFRFNFLPSEEDEGGEACKSSDTPSVPERPAKVLHVTRREMVKLAASSEAEVTSAEFCGGSVRINHVLSAAAQADIQIIDAHKDSEREEQSDCAQAIHQHSDLIPGVYEGGLKIWECSYDLVEHLHGAGIQFEGQRVLEIGCGAALPGLYALLMGAGAVDFQDYNEEVLNHVTVPNVAANMLKALEMKQARMACPLRRSPRKLQQGQMPRIRLGDAAKAVSVRFFAGDWAKLQEIFSEQFASDERLKYDIILTSETIYQQTTHMKLLDLIKSCLSASGVVYLAAKSHYFGVGGSLRDFERTVIVDGLLSSQVVFKGTGQGVTREILELKWKPG